MLKIKNTVLSLIFFSLLSTSNFVQAYSGQDLDFQDQLQSVKTGMDSVSGSTNSVEYNNATNWTIDLPNETDFNFEAEIIENIPEGSNYINNSLNLPAGFSAQFSNDSGASWNNNDSGNVTNIKVSPNNAILGSSSITTQLNFSTGIGVINDKNGGGDGYVPFVFPETDRVMLFYHKVSGSSRGINCFFISTGLQCPGYPKSLDNSSGFPGDYIHSYHQNQINVSGRAYLTGKDITNNVFGIDCWDTNTDSFCGFYPIPGGDYGNSIKLNQYDNTKLLFISNSVLQCFDTTINDFCTTPWVDQSVPGFSNSSYSQTELYENRYLIGVSSESGTSRICYDLSSLPAVNCSGYPLSDTGPFMIPSPYLDTNGNLIGFCSSVSTCTDLSGNSLSVPSFLSGISSVVESVIVGSKVFVADSNSTAWCWDYAINNFCANFMDSDLVAGKRDWRKNNQDGISGLVNPNGTADYGYTYNDGCMYGLGDSRTLWSFEPETGNSPCSKISSSATISSQEDVFYCGPKEATKTPKILPSSLTVPAFSSNGDVLYPNLSTINYYILNSTDNSVLLSGTHDLNSDFLLDLSLIDFIDNPSVIVLFDYIGTSTTPLIAQVEYQTLDPAQICFQTVQNKCGINKITNYAQAEYTIPVQTTPNGDITEISKYQQQLSTEIAVTNSVACPVDNSEDDKATLISAGFKPMKYFGLGGVVMYCIFLTYKNRKRIISSHTTSI